MSADTRAEANAAHEPRKAASSPAPALLQSQRRAATPNPRGFGERRGRSAADGSASCVEDEDGCYPTVRLPREQIEKSVSRLSHTNRPATVLGPLLPPRVLPPVEVDKSVDRLYKQCLETQKKKKEAREAKVLAASQAAQRRLAPEELDESVGRLYTNSVKAKQQKQEQLKKKFLANYERRPDVAAREKATHSVVHLYEEEKTRAQARRQALLDKYIRPTEPRMKKADATELKTIVERLTQQQ